MWRVGTKAMWITLITLAIFFVSCGKGTDSSDSSATLPTAINVR